MLKDEELLSLQSMSAEGTVDKAAEAAKKQAKANPLSKRNGKVDDSVLEHACNGRQQMS